MSTQRYKTVPRLRERNFAAKQPQGEDAYAYEHELHRLTETVAQLDAQIQQQQQQRQQQYPSSWVAPVDKNDYFWQERQRADEGYSLGGGLFCNGQSIKRCCLNGCDCGASCAAVILNVICLFLLIFLSMALLSLFQGFFGKK